MPESFDISSLLCCIYDFTGFKYKIRIVSKTYKRYNVKRMGRLMKGNMKIKCKNCEKRFDYEKHTGICPKCGHYTRNNEKVDETKTLVLKKLKKLLFFYLQIRLLYRSSLCYVSVLP